MKPEIVMYHNAPTEARESIREKGLLVFMSDAAQAARERNEPEKGLGGIFFDTVPTTAGRFDTWQVDVSGLDIEPDETTDISGIGGEWEGHEWWVLWGENVLPNRLKLFHEGVSK